MINKISSLPNYCNGKLYKRWDRVSNIFGENTILACKTGKKGENIVLLIPGDGTRELITNNGKIMDITGEDGIRRTYSYQRTGNGIEGKMVIEKSKDKPLPLITYANWLVRNLLPQKVNLTLNTEHPNSKIFLPELESIADLKDINRVTVKSVKASEFIDTLNPIPSKLEFTLKDGSVININSPSAGNIFMSNNSGIKPETHPLEYINVVV